MRKLSSSIVGYQHDMTTHLTAKSKRTLAALSALGATLWLAPAWAQNFPVTATQHETANEIASKGVSPSDLTDNAPDRYTVKSGDTLWSVSAMFLKSPWRWPELWGVNRNDINNPHLIFPGQTLVLVRTANSANLRIRDAGNTDMDAGSGSSGSGNGSGGGGNSNGVASDNSGELRTVRLSPKTRYQNLADEALPTLQSSYIEPFLVEPLIVNVDEFTKAPRIVSTQEDRVVLSSGDRAYARGPLDAPLLDDQPKEKIFRVLGTATPLTHPDTGALLGYEAIYEGKARLVRGESHTDTLDEDKKVVSSVVPATIDIMDVKREIGVGDRLLPEPKMQLQTYTPHAPPKPMESRIVSVYGTGAVNAAQNHVVTITGGTLDGIDAGTVLAILKDGPKVADDENATKPMIKLPNERVGLLMVFRTFEHLSYGLILEITDAVHIGDRLVSPH